MNNTHLEILHSCQENFQKLKQITTPNIYLRRLEELDHKISEPSLWLNPTAAALLIKERKNLSELLELLTQTEIELQLYQEAIMANHLSEPDFQQLVSLDNNVRSILFKQMMHDPIDQSPAILTINSGAGGLESANWVSMLLRMYSRYAVNNGFKVELLDKKVSDEHSAICTDSASIRIEGPYAYGFLKGESGVHRLIRNSPFNAGNARQTSFAAVQVSADIEDTIDIKIDEKDLEITTMRSSGSGGQGVNKIESAVRLKHIPTGLVINSRAERSQHDNRRTAMKMLKSKLYDLELKKKQQEQDKQISALSDVSFGHQIRSYFLEPQQIVKDHRSEFEIRDFHKVLDGDLQSFIEAFLISNAK